jgi:RPA family protein
VNVAIEPESIATVDEATREAWLAEAVEHTGTRIDTVEAGRAPFGERARRAYGEDMSGLIEAIETID